MASWDLCADPIGVVRRPRGLLASYLTA